MVVAIDIMRAEANAFHDNATAARRQHNLNLLGDEKANPALRDSIALDEACRSVAIIQAALDSKSYAVWKQNGWQDCRRVVITESVITDALETLQLPLVAEKADGWAVCRGWREWSSLLRSRLRFAPQAILAE